MINDYTDTIVAVEKPNGLDGYGKSTYAPATTEKCRWQPVSILKQKPTADNTIIQVRAYFGPEVDIVNNSRVCKDSVNYIAVEVADRNFVGYGSHKEVLLKYE